jgi:hypothetical protein
MLSKLRYNNICKKFISILNTTSKTFEKEIKNNTKSFIYNSKITINDLLLYRFNYVEKGFTFARVLSKINNDKLNNNDGKIFKLNSISTKDNQIPSFIYKNLYNYLFDGLAKLFKFSNKIIVIDGTYSNTNINHNGNVETSLSLVMYDPINSLNLDINFTGGDKKNNEKIKLQEYITKNIDMFKNKIIIADRAYHCYDFFKFLNDNNINFIIRLKDKDAKFKNKDLEIIKNDIKQLKSNFKFQVLMNIKKIIIKKYFIVN